MPSTPAPTMQAVALLERAIDYTRIALSGVRADLLDAPTPCAQWDLRTLLEHMDDALAAFTEAADLGTVDLRPLATQPESHRLRRVHPQSSFEFGATVEDALRQRIGLADALRRRRDSSLQLPKCCRIGRRHRIQFCAQLWLDVGGHRKWTCQHRPGGALTGLGGVLYRIA